MNKKTSLTDALSKREAHNDYLDESVSTDTDAIKPAPVKARPDRANKTNITGYFDKPVKWELQELATERSRAKGRRVTVQELLAEALNDLFKKYGKPEIATTNSKPTGNS